MSNNEYNDFYSYLLYIKRMNPNSNLGKLDFMISYLQENLNKVASEEHLNKDFQLTANRTIYDILELLSGYNRILHSLNFHKDQLYEDGYTELFFIAEDLKPHYKDYFYHEKKQEEEFRKYLQKIYNEAKLLEGLQVDLKDLDNMASKIVKDYKDKGE